MAKTPAKPQQQQGGTGGSTQQQQGQQPDDAPRQAGQPVFRDWASI
jgi:hypothetical protein